MKVCLLLILICLRTTTFAQQQKADDALLLEYYQNQRFGDALDYLKKINPEPVTDPKTLSSLAYTSQMAGDLAGAEGYCLRLYNQDSGRMALLFSLGNINLRRGNNGKALIYYKKILLRDSTNFNVNKQLATLSQNMGNVPNAMTYLQKANTLNPADPDVAAELATVYINQKAFAKADIVLSKAMAADTGNTLLLRDKATVDYHLNKFPQTILICAKLIAGGERASELINILGSSYFMVKSYQNCIAVFQLLEQAEMATESSYYYTAMSFKALDDHKKAIFYFKKAVKEAISSNVDSYYNEIGDSYEKIHHLPDAITAYQKSLLYNTKPVITYYVLANLYDAELKDKSRAIWYYRKYIKANPPEPQKSYLDYSKKRLNYLRR